MSNTKQCDCCDLFRDDYEVETVPSAQPGVKYIVCEDCIEQCPNGTICDLSGKTMKPDIEAALAAHGGHGGHGGGGTSNGHPGYNHPGYNAQQLVQQFAAQNGGFAQYPAPKQVHEIPDDAECDRHGGHWGDDQTCEKCTDEDGDPKKYRKPKPPPRFLTKTQTGVQIDSELERLKLQLKFGLTDQGKPLTAAERADIQKIVDKYEAPDFDEQDAINSILGPS